MNNRLIISLALLGSVALASNARCQGGRPQVVERYVLRGHTPPTAALLQPLGRLPETNSLRLAISLPLRNPEALASLLQRLYDPASPDYRHYLTPAQFTEGFGPTVEDYQAVINFAKANRLAITSTHESRVLLDVRGIASDVESAFHVTLRTYQHPTEDRQFYAPDVEPWVDTSLPKLDVAGLSDYALLRSALHKIPTGTHTGPAGGSGPGGYYMGQDFRNAYAPGVSLQGSGQMVGLFEADGYYASDIATYEDVAGLTPVPLQNVLIDNFSGTPGSGNGEVALDIEMAISMSPGLAAVVVFESPNNVSDWLDILDSMASSNQIKQFSSSWGYTGGSDPNTSFDSSFQQMAAQGQTFFQASGDGDAWVTPVWVPADSPYVTSVGGTTLTMSGFGVAYSSETVWNSGNLGASNVWFAGGNGYWGSGGGVSTVYSIPSWQQAVSMVANQGSTNMRNIPDVALTALDVWVSYDDGGSESYFGTSCSPPLWAGFAALANEQAANSNKPPVGFLNPAIYAIGHGPNYGLCFHDITAGSNTSSGSPAKFFAVPGYDLCTGWGTPTGSNLINALAGIYQPSITSQPASQTNVFASNASFDVTATSATPLSYQWHFDGTNIAGATLTNLHVTNLTRASAGSYAVVVTNQWGALTSSVAILTVSRATPIMTWTSPAPITYGAALTSVQLDATANVTGSFAYTPTDGTVLNAGTHTLSVIFTPTDTVDYSNATNTVSLIVSPAPLTVTAANTNRAYGQANPVFTGIIIGVTNGDNITAAYSCSAIATSPVGTYPVVPGTAVGTDLTNYTITYANGTLTVNPAALTITANNRTKTYGQTVIFAGTEFTTGGLVNGDTVTTVTLTSSGAAATATVAGSPYNIVPNAAVGTLLANYTITYINGTLTVDETTPIMTWTSPAPIIYGAALTSVQLNATANVPGSFAYTPTNGTVLNAGTHTLSVIFTPTDPVDYSNATNTVSLIVSPAPLTVTAANTNRAYGQANPVFTGIIIGVTNGDNITAAYSCSATTTSPVGTYPVVPGTAVGTDLTNYTITYANGTLTVNPAALTITANNRTKTYGQTVTFAGTEFTTGGLVNGDTVTTVTLTSSGAAATATVAGSPYNIVPSAAVGTGLANYTITYINGTLTVDEAILIMTWPNPAPITYGAALTSIQLDATANVPGSFAYSPTNGSVLNAGTHTLSVIFTPTDTVDYSNATNTVSLILSPAPLTVTAANTNRVYGQANPVFTGIITGVTNGDDITATYSTTATINSPLGTYAIVPSLVDPNNRQTNYTVSLLNGTLTVGLATAIMTWTNPAPIIYGAALTSIQLDATANVPGSFAYNPTNGSVLNAGTNTLSVIFTPTDTVDYNSVTDSVSLVVSPASLTVTASSFSRNFGEANPVFTGTITGVTNGDDITAIYSCSATTGSPMGTYPIVPSLVDPNDLQTNYTVNLVAGILVVGHPAEVFTWTNPAPIIYGAALTSIQLDATVNIPGNYAYNPTNGAVLNTGTNTLSIIFTPTDTVDYNSVTDSVSLVVSPAPLTVTAADTNRAYGQANPEFTGTITGVTNGDNITAAYSCSATTTSPVGTYPVLPGTALGTDLTNYTITYANGTLTVNPAALSITADNRTKTYGQTVTFAGAEFTTGGLVNGDTVTSVTLTCSGAAATATVAGSPYAIVPSTPVGTGLANYTITYFNGSLTVSPAVLTIAANTQTKTYGQSVTFTATEFTTGGLLNNDAVNSVTLSSSGAAATAAVLGSPYTIVPNAAAGTGLSNYTISYVNGSLTVSPAVLTIAANTQTKTYGQSVTFTATEFTTGGLLNGDAVNSVALSSSGAAATAAVLGSPYTIVVSAAVGAGLANYTITYVNGTLKINPAALTVTANNQSKTYGQSLTFAGTEFTTSGLLNSDAVNSVTLSSSGAAANAAVLGLPYTIVPSAAVGTGLANYTITYANGTLTVNPAALIITANTQTKTYGQSLTFAGTEFTTSGLLNNDAVNSVTLSSSGAATTAARGSPYTIVPGAAVGTGLSNYTITYFNGSLTVNPGVLTITANTQTKTYGVTFTATEFTTSGLLNSDAVNSVTLSSSGAAATAGVLGSPYTIVPSAAVGSGLSNYTITYVNGTLIVSPASSTVTNLVALDKVYNGTTNATLDATNAGVAGALNGDNVTLVTSNAVAYFADKNVGANKPVTIFGLTLSGANAGNYTLTQPQGLTANITPAGLAIISGITANNKVYDGTTTATLSSNNVVLSGAFDGDTVSLITNGYVARFANASAGTGIAVTVSGLTLSGVSAGNYALTQPEDLVANITSPSIPSPRVQIFASLPNIVISWTTIATDYVLNHTASLTPPVTWSPVTNSITVNGTNNTVIINASSGIQYFELIEAP